MIDAISVSTSALRAQQQHIDAISNNLANMQTPGFKKTRISFSALANHSIGAQDVTTDPTQLESGHGVELSFNQLVSEQGAVKQTGRELDLSIDGKGFFEVKNDSGQLMYTRAGQLMVDAEGFLATLSGHRLSQDIVIPPEANAIEIRSNGEIVASFSDDAPIEILDRLQIANFSSPENLVAASGNNFLASEASGAATLGFPGETGYGSVFQGTLEQSNVNLIEEMSNLVMAQRAYQLNARVLQASDQVLETINNLRR